MPLVSHMWRLRFLAAAFWVGLFSFPFWCVHMWGACTWVSSCEHLPVPMQRSQEAIRGLPSSLFTLLLQGKVTHGTKIWLFLLGWLDSEFPGSARLKALKLGVTSIQSHCQAFYINCGSNSLPTESSPQPHVTFLLVCLLRAPNPKVSSMQYPALGR